MGAYGYRSDQRGKRGDRGQSAASPRVHCSWRTFFSVPTGRRCWRDFITAVRQKTKDLKSGVLSKA